MVTTSIMKRMRAVITLSRSARRITDEEDCSDEDGEDGEDGKGASQCDRWQSRNDEW